MLFISRIISFERLLFFTHPICPPTLELSEILNKFAVFSKPISSILLKIFLDCSSNEIFCSFIKTISDKLYSNKNSSFSILLIFSIKSFLSIFILLEYFAYIKFFHSFSISIFSFKSLIDISKFFK